MKPAAFDYVRPGTLEDACRVLADAADGMRSIKVVAGSQSLGPMLNLRLVQPELLVDIARLPGLADVRVEKKRLVLGACVTHAAVEDGIGGTGGIAHGDLTAAFLARVAHGIAYRAIRNRGTVGGSLVHADPSAEWVSMLPLIGGVAIAVSRDGRREVPLPELMVGAFETVLQPEEVLTELHLEPLPAKARWGFVKLCRKTGEFAQGMAGLICDPDRKTARLVIGAVDSKPILVADARPLFGGKAKPPLAARFDRNAAARLLADNGFPAGSYEHRVHLAAITRAVAAADA